MAQILTKVQSLLFDDDHGGAYTVTSVRRLAFSSCGDTRDGWAYSAYALRAALPFEKSGKKQLICYYVCVNTRFEYVRPLLREM
jgi:hypothetical protein